MASPAALITPQQRKTIFDALTKRFVNSELITLVYDLGVDWENLDGDTRGEKVVALMTYCTNTRTLDALIAAIKAARPDIQI